MLEFVSVRGRERRPYDEPQQPEVPAIHPFEDNMPHTVNLRTFLRAEPASFRTLNHTSEFCDPLCFPLLFAAGDFGWNPQIVKANNRRLTLLDFYSYR